MNLGLARRPDTRMQRALSSPSALRSPLTRCPLGLLGTSQVVRLGIVVACLSAMAACASVPHEASGVLLVVKHFTEDGFPPETTVGVLTLLSEEPSGRVANVNNGVFWYSRNAVFAITFDVDGCSSNPDVTSVFVSSIRTSRAEAAADVWRWLEVAEPPTMPSRAISDEATHEYFQSTWTRGGHDVHVKAWVTSYEAEWLGVLQIYPHQVVLVY